MNKLDLLPNELWFLIFDYLSSFDQFKAFSQIKNQRIEHLLASRSFALNTKILSHAQMNDMITMPQFFTLLNTIIMSESCASVAFYDYWTKMPSVTQFTPSIQQLIITKAEYYANGLVSMLIEPLALNKTLQYLHLVFEYPDSVYMNVLMKLAAMPISIPTMILEVRKDHTRRTVNMRRSFYPQIEWFWPHTVHLTLSIQHPFELLFIFRYHAISHLEHLNVTIERESYLKQRSLRYIRFYDIDIRQRADAVRLQTLIVRHLGLRELVKLLESLHMPLLEKLILIDIFDETLDHLEKFQYVVNHHHLPSLKTLAFLMCFPKELKEILDTHLITHNKTWPFNNVAYHFGKSILSEWFIHHDIRETVLLFYTCPFDMLLQYTRTVYNHSFADYFNVIEQQYTKWSNQSKSTSDGRLETLHLRFFNIKRSVSMEEIISSWSNRWFSRLRSVSFAFKHTSITQSQRVYIIDQILSISPRLSHLIVECNDLRHCSRSNTNVKHVELILDSYCSNPNEYICPRHLFELLPGISCLETSNHTIESNESLVTFVVEIINTFPQLVELTLNKEGHMPIDVETQWAILHAIFAAETKRQLTFNTCQIIFPKNATIRMWL